jgi:ketosteroid isomerase-like protein
VGAVAPGSRDTTRVVSEENVEVVRQIHEVWNTGDLDAWLELLNPDIDWVAAREDPDAATHRGREGVREYVQQWIDAVGFLRVEPLEYVDAGDRVVAFVRFIGQGAVSGVPVNVEQAQVVTIKERKVERVEEYFDRAEALEAAGLSE